jgi:hypothetical protein
VGRMFYACLAVILASCSVTARSIHVHVSADHVHHDHHHGPASHEHGGGPSTPNGDGLRVSSCPAATHAVFFKLSSKAASVPLTWTVSLPPVDTFVLPPPPAGRLERVVLDPRQHSPPARTAAPPRAPPVTHTA